LRRALEAAPSDIAVATKAAVKIAGLNVIEIFLTSDVSKSERVPGALHAKD
jgi:hypothetical protein